MVHYVVWKSNPPMTGNAAAFAPKEALLDAESVHDERASNDADFRADLDLRALASDPIMVHRPKGRSVPFIFASPHSGRSYPESFAKRTRLDPVSLRRSEDAYVDELFASVTEFGAPLIAARFPRASARNPTYEVVGRGLISITTSPLPDKSSPSTRSTPR